MRKKVNKIADAEIWSGDYTPSHQGLFKIIGVVIIAVMIIWFISAVVA